MKTAQQLKEGYAFLIGDDDYYEFKIERLIVYRRTRHKVTAKWKVHCIVKEYLDTRLVVKDQICNTEVTVVIPYSNIQFTSIFL